MRWRAGMGQNLLARRRSNPGTMNKKPITEAMRAKWREVSRKRRAAAKRLGRRGLSPVAGIEAHLRRLTPPGALRSRKRFDLPKAPELSELSKSMGVSPGLEMIESAVRRLDPETAFFLGYGLAVAGRQFLAELESKARPDGPKK